MSYRWTFDDRAGDTYEVEINPNKMGKLLAAKAITTKVTTAVDGQTLFFEGRRPPQSWQFSGVLESRDHYMALQRWVYDKGRIVIKDHFERLISVVLTDFDAQPKRSLGKYWRHDYTCIGLVYDVDDSNTVLEAQP